jgi:hypothetical protein
METFDANIVTILWEEKVHSIRFAVRLGVCVCVCVCVYIYIYRYTCLFKMIVGVQLSSGNSAPNPGDNHPLTIPFEGVMHSFERGCTLVFLNGRYQSEPLLKPLPMM